MQKYNSASKYVKNSMNCKRLFVIFTDNQAIRLLVSCKKMFWPNQSFVYGFLAQNPLIENNSSKELQREKTLCACAVGNCLISSKLIHLIS